MNVTQETKNLIENINSFSAKQIKNYIEVSLIIEAAVSYNNSAAFNDLIFKAKYVKGLKSVLSNRIVIGDDFMEKILKEFNFSLQQFSEMLKNIMTSSDEKTIKQFGDKYFALNQESIVNLMDLAEDLATCKEFFNSNPELALPS